MNSVDRHGMEFRAGDLCLWKEGRCLRRLLEKPAAGKGLVRTRAIRDWRNYFDAEHAPNWEILARGNPDDPVPDHFEPVRDKDGKPVLECAWCGGTGVLIIVSDGTGRGTCASGCGTRAEQCATMPSVLDVYASGEEPKVGDRVYVQHEGAAFVRKVLPNGTARIAGVRDGVEAVRHLSQMVLICRDDPDAKPPEKPALATVPDLDEGLDLCPPAAMLEEIFRAKAMLLHGDSAWSANLLRGEYVAVLQRGADVRVLRIDHKEIDCRGGEIEPSLPKRRRSAQAFVSLCIEKARTFWDGEAGRR